MSKAKDEPQIVAAPASGWCDPNAGGCHIDTADEAASAEANNNKDAAGDVPDATTDERHRHLSLPTR
ncbi:hypothetical protein ALI144C_01935 [Actinosynnema sp. ALI-1.44]|uniref:hypothetical protein n=1 Tax=Actinosynnema sp. ALI-1.44 TaxID=1933779 RepID=UPI00097CADB1|nr:hypothetical protein [Actinosynnema sp. ALI-1.44]ONI91006.1 hypothetical protein ALI144C_01935 [Actinosynnema sp. ALI-1.44]